MQNLDKHYLRKKYLYIRSNISLNYLKYASYKISNLLFSLNEYKKCENIFAFINTKNEILTDRIIKNSFELNKKVFVPVLTKTKGKMIFSQIYRETKFLKNHYGILEPEICKNILEYSNNKTFVVIPAIIYSKDKFRIGYGGGYYDRFLKNSNSLCNAGVCLNNFLIESFNVSPFDKRVDYVITEKNIIY